MSGDQTDGAAEDGGTGNDGGNAGFQCSPPAVPCCLTACRLTAAERAATSAEETDIDAVELPLPGADILDFSRGVTDLDAVGKEASGDTKVCGSFWEPGGQEGFCSIPGPQIKAVCRCPLARGWVAWAEHRTKAQPHGKSWGRADRDSCFSRTPQKRVIFETVEISMGNGSLFQNLLQ